MAYGNSYNNEGLGDSFWNGFQRSTEGVNQMRRDRGLAEIEAAQPTTIDGSTPPGLGDVGQNDDRAYGAQDTAAGIQSGTAVNNSPGSPGPQRFSVMGQVADSADDARAAARASLYRRTGAPEAANKELEAANQISSGKSLAKINAYKAKSAEREDSNDSATFAVQQQMAQYVKDQGVDASTPSGAADLAAHHVQALVSRGLTAEAEKISKSYTNVLINQIKGTQEQRSEAVVGVQQALQNGSPAALKLALSRLDSFLPNGGRVDDVQAGPQPGTYVISRTESDGTQNQKPVTTDQLNQMLDMVTGSKFDAQSQSFIKNRLDVKNVQAQIDAHKAAAGASGALASEYAARTDVIKHTGAQQVKLDAILAKDPEERTPEEDAFIEGEHERSQLASERKRMPMGRGGGGEKLTVKINPDGSQVVAKPDGSLWSKGRKDTEFKEVTPGGPIRGATAPTRSDVEDARNTQPPAGVTAPSPSGGGGAPMRVSGPEDWAKVPQGAQYIDPTGRTRIKQ